MPLGDGEVVNPPLPATPTSTHRQPVANTQGDLNKQDTLGDVKPLSDESQQQASCTHDQTLSSAEGEIHRDESGKDASGDHCRLHRLQMKEQQAKKPAQKMETESRSKME